MVAPALRHHSVTSLMQELLSTHGFKKFLKVRPGEMLLTLAVGAAIAHWILLQRPALAFRKVLRVRTGGKVELECAKLIPWLLGVPTLQVILYDGENYGYSMSASKALELEEKENKRSPEMPFIWDLFFLVNQDLFDFQEWSIQEILDDSRINKAALVVLSETHYLASINRHYADLHGLASSEVLINPFDVLSLTDKGNSVLWELSEPNRKSRSFVDDAAFQSFHSTVENLSEVETYVVENLEETVEGLPQLLVGNLGMKAFHLKDVYGGERVTEAVLLPIYGLAVDTSDWCVFVYDEDVDFEEFYGECVFDLLDIQKYPSGPYDFAHVEWATHVMTAIREERDEADYYGGEDGDDEDAADEAMFVDLFIRMRPMLPAHLRWAQQLTLLGWKIYERDSTPSQLAPAFFTDSLSRGAIPVICLDEVFVPNASPEIGALLMNMGRLYPAGALVLFKTVVCKPVAGGYYSVGGVLLNEGGWNNFVFNSRVVNIDAIYQQVEEKFDLDELAAAYVDTEGKFAFDFACLSQTLETGMHRMRLLPQGEWLHFVPAD